MRRQRNVSRTRQYSANLGHVHRPERERLLVELKATFPLGAIIDLELELNGMRTQVSGVVRISYPFPGMGVAFRDMTKENRVQIER